MARGPHLSELAAEWQALGAKPQHVRRIFLAWAGLAPWEARKGESFPKAVAEALPGIRERLDRLSHALPVRSAEAETVKLILGLEDGECVESVLLPRQGLCVSTQVGCAVGCVFCMTGKGGLVRQLSSAEIVAQYCEARRVRSDVRKIVLMGMGEPSHNFDAVCEAVEFFGNVCGLAHKDIVVSTVGDHRLFDRLPALSVRPALALSLHTTDNALRRKLLTNSKDIPVETLLERTLDYADETGYPAQIEWTLMAGINDLTGGQPVDTIVMNITRMADMVHEAVPGCRLYIQSVLPVNTRRLAYPGLKGHNPQVRTLNARLVQLCDAKPWCTFVDLAPLLSDADGELRIDLTKDGIHLHPAGYVIWTDYLKKQKYLK